MFKNVEELKSFILWAKDEKISKFKADNLEIEFSPLALASSYDLEESTSSNEELPTTDLNEVDDDLLYHSS